MLYLKLLALAVLSGFTGSDALSFRPNAGSLSSLFSGLNRDPFFTFPEVDETKIPEVLRRMAIPRAETEDHIETLRQSCHRNAQQSCPALTMISLSSSETLCVMKREGHDHFPLREGGFGTCDVSIVQLDDFPFTVTRIVCGDHEVDCSSNGHSIAGRSQQAIAHQGSFHIEAAVKLSPVAHLVIPNPMREFDQKPSVAKIFHLPKIWSTPEAFMNAVLGNRAKVIEDEKKRAIIR